MNRSSLLQFFFSWARADVGSFKKWFSLPFFFPAAVLL